MIAAQVTQVGGQDLVHTGLVLTFTDERLELITKSVERLLGQIVLHFGDPVVGQAVFQRIVQVDFAVKHVSPLKQNSQLSAVSGVAW